MERQKEDAEKAEEAQIRRWESTLTTIMELRSGGLTDEAKWKEVNRAEYLRKHRKANAIYSAGHSIRKRVERNAGQTFQIF